MKTGIILLSHGSRLPEAQITLRKIIDQVVATGDFEVVEGASLQFNQPDLPTTIIKVAEMGMERIIVVPLFLYQGMHMKKDIPGIINEHRLIYPDIDIVMTGNIGADPKLVEILLDRIGEVN